MIKQKKRTRRTQATRSSVRANTKNTMKNTSDAKINHLSYPSLRREQLKTIKSKKRKKSDVLISEDSRKRAASNTTMIVVSPISTQMRSQTWSCHMMMRISSDCSQALKIRGYGKCVSRRTMSASL
jgi:hypothetical protein